MRDIPASFAEVPFAGGIAPAWFARPERSSWEVVHGPLAVVLMLGPVLHKKDDRQ